MSDSRSVLVVTAHPDDAEILCGGTIARYRAAGDDVAICHACTGNLGHVEIPPSELAPMRWDEAERAAAVVGAKHYTLGCGDLHLIEAEEVVRRLAGIIREVRPTVIITHDPGDYMPDHTDVAPIVLKASFVATLPQYDGVGGEVWGVVPPVYFMDTIMGVGFEPEEYVDISETYETKTRMLECHESQVKWLRDHDGIDIMENIRVLSRYRGLQCGAEYAEAFRRHRVWPRMTAERLLP